MAANPLQMRDASRGILSQNQLLSMSGGAPGAQASVYAPVDVSGYGGQPGRPQYIPGYDPNKMSLSGTLADHYNSAGLQAYENQALRTGPSAWANLAKSDQDAQAAAQHDKAAAEGSGQVAGQMDSLAASGGLSSGARERAATEGSKNVLSMQQGIDRQAGLNKLQIGMNDEQNRIEQLSQVPGMELNRANMYMNAKGQDVTNQMNETGRQNAFNANAYGQQMQGWAAGQQANATANSGKK